MRRLSVLGQQAGVTGLYCCRPQSSSLASLPTAAADFSVSCTRRAEAEAFQFHGGIGTALRSRGSADDGNAGTHPGRHPPFPPAERSWNPFPRKDLHTSPDGANGPSPSERDAPLPPATVARPLPTQLWKRQTNPSRSRPPACSKPTLPSRTRKDSDSSVHVPQGPGTDRHDSLLCCILSLIPVLAACARKAIACASIYMSPIPVHLPAFP